MFKMPSKKILEIPEKGNGSSVNPKSESNEEVISHPNDDHWVNLFTLPEKVEKDNIVLDLVSAVEQLIRARHISENSLNELQKRHHHAKDQIESLQKEITQVRKALDNKEREVKEWESKLTDKNLAIDQLMEDYNMLQANVANEIRELKNAYEMERGKNQQVQQQNLKESLENMTLLKKNEETIVLLRTENENLKKSYDNIRKENTYMVSVVNDFTNRMAVSFSQYTKVSLKEHRNDGEA
jgi:chromosome segregation ATPase